MKRYISGLVLCALAVPGLVASTPVTQRQLDTMAERTAACIACHGAEGRATSSGYFPRIAGKPQAYLYQQLVHFRQGRRINPLDFIVLACAGLMFYLSGANEKFSEFGVQMMQAILFLYAVEFMLHGPQAQSTAARMTLPGVFAVGSLVVLL